ncbi:MAG TPA: SPOR domain-containing protein [Burkholderiales bacterium]
MANDLPEDTQLKRRARRRLIGAIALVLLAVVVLPMIFDAEQKPLDQDVSIQIPSQGDYVAKPPSAPAQPAAPAADAKAAPEAPKDVTPPKQANKDGKDTVALPGDNKGPAVIPPPVPEKGTPKAETKDETRDAAKTEAKDVAKADAAKARAEAEAKARAEAEKAKAKAAEEKAHAKAESERAAALLNGGNNAPTSPKSDKIASAGSFAIQIGAFSSVEKAQEVRDKLSAAGLSSYAEKVSTKSGEVTRVRAGPFPSKEAADAARARIAGLGFASASVVHR